MSRQSSTTSRSKRRVIGTTFIAAFCTAIPLWLATGCNIVTAANYIVNGPGKMPAQYTLPEKKIVIFIDDRTNVVPRARLQRKIAMRATTELLQNQRVVPAALSPDTMTRLASGESAGEIMAIDEIGRRAGADIVIYAVPRGFSLVEKQGPQPTCLLDVKVIDTTTGNRLWPDPTQPPYHSLKVQLAYQQLDAYQDRDRVSQVQEQLAELTGLRLAQLFFDHEPNPLDAQVEP